MNDSLMKDEYYWNLMSRYLADDLSLDETEELLQWLNEDSSRAESLKELQETWDMSKAYPEKFYVDQDAALLKVRRAVLSPKHPEKNWLDHTYYRWIAIAGAVLVIAGALYWALRHFTGADLIEIETLAGERKEVVLPDGSRVWLNEVSTLSYRSKLSGGDTRLVKLKGEAYFEIKSDTKKQFLIEAGDAEVLSSESAVNVLSGANGDVRAAVLTGSVLFTANDQLEQKMMLSQGEEGVSYKEGYMDKKAYRDLNFLGWKTRRLNFSNSTLSEVIGSVERTYGVKFYVKEPSLLSGRLTASFNQASIDRVIGEMEVLLGLQIEKVGSVYLVGRKG